MGNYIEPLISTHYQFCWKSTFGSRLKRLKQQSKTRLFLKDKNPLLFVPDHKIHNKAGEPGTYAIVTV